MYQNVYFEKEKSIIHCWDDMKGYFTKKYRNYAYYRDGNGSHESIHGERLKKINFWNKEDNLTLYESDVNEVTRFLIDEYGDSDEVSVGHVTLTFDIEVEIASWNDDCGYELWEGSRNKIITGVMTDFDLKKEIKHDHAHHHEKTTKEITALLINYSSPRAKFSIPGLVNKKKQLIIPYTLDNNDMRFATNQGFNTGDHFFSYLKDSFDVLYEEGKTDPKMMSVGLHCRLIGKPGRIQSLKKFLDYILKHEDVWICKRIDIAKHWIKNYS